MVAAVLLAHPLAWSLAPGATGLVGSLVTLSLVVAAVARNKYMLLMCLCGLLAGL